MPERKITDAECLALSKLLDEASLPASCREYMAKHDQQKSAWDGASHKDFMISKHTKLQRRLTSTNR